jgi:transcriptional regulator of met regulon
MDNTHPYQLGTIITGSFCPESTGKPQPFSFTVVDTFEPFTCSVVLVVSIASPSLILPETAVLKLYDRRFSPELREARDATAWDPTLEHALHSFNSQPHPKVIAHGHSDSYWALDYDQHDPDDLRNPALWTLGHLEAYLQVWTDHIRKSEIKVYRHLRDLQGKQVPQLYGTISCTVLGTVVEGVLLQYIGPPAFKLGEVTQRCTDKERWNEIGKAAVQLVRDIGDRGVLNYDVRVDNIIVVDTPIPEALPDGDTGSLEGDGVATAPSLFVIDFGTARVRSKSEDDAQWTKARRLEQAEDAIGFACKRRMGDAFPFEATWEPFSEGDDLLCHWDSDSDSD